MANENNLIRPEDLTPSERRENARKAGKASGAARRRKRDLKSTMKTLLEMPVADNDIYNALAKMGIAPESIDNHTAVVVALMQKAMSGNVKAFKEIRNLLGEDTDNERLKLQQKEFKLKESRQDTGKTEGRIAELIEGLKDDLHE